jgi:hypothetical protein
MAGIQIPDSPITETVQIMDIQSLNIECYKIRAIKNLKKGQVFEWSKRFAPFIYNFKIK